MHIDYYISTLEATALLIFKVAVCVFWSKQKDALKGATVLRAEVIHKLSEIVGKDNIYTTLEDFILLYLGFVCNSLWKREVQTYGE